MIWLIVAILVFQLFVALILALAARSIIDEIRDLPKTFPPIPDCKFKDQPCLATQCLYSPGSEPERICALREEDKKNQGQKIPQVIPAPRWNDRSPPGEE